MRFCDALAGKFPSALQNVELSEGEDAPIFLFSAGWRSGSTLLQRMLCSDPSLLVWGEPFEDRLIIPRMFQMIRDYTTEDAHLKYSISDTQTELSSEWIANLNPGYSNLLLAQREFLQGCLKRTAIERGFSRWGMKSVRLTAEHAKYLKFLFPRAKILFLVRNPLDAWNSYSGKSWHASYPDFKVDNAVKFFTHWNMLASSFIKSREELGAFSITYESLVNEEGIDSQVEAFLGINIDSRVLRQKIGSTAERKPRKRHQLAKLLARRILGSTAKKLDYEI